MNKILVGLMLTIFIGTSCKKEEKYVEPKLTILSLSKDPINVSDTLKITYEISGFDTYNDIEVLIDGNICEVLSNTGSVIEIIVPYGVREYGSEIILRYQEYTSLTYNVTIDLIPMVTDFFPKSGDGGDTLRIVGFGFDKLVPVKVIIINSLPAEIINSNDTLLTALIPKGCGNGKIRLQSYYAPGGTIDGELVYWLDKEIVCGDFIYNFEAYSGNKFPMAQKITDLSTTEIVSYERNNGILQKITYSTIKYDVYKYKNNVIDSILNYDNGDLVSYETFLIHDGSDEVIHNFYDSDGERKKYYIYKFYENKMTEWDFYEFSEELGDLYHSANNSFSQEIDEYKLDRTVYNTDGSINYHPVYVGFLDINNTPLDFNIPGFPLSKEDIWIYNSENTYHNYYNEFGLLVKRVRCPLRISETFGYIQEYEYE